MRTLKTLLPLLLMTVLGILPALAKGRLTDRAFNYMPPYSTRPTNKTTIIIGLGALVEFMEEIKLANQVKKSARKNLETLQREREEYEGLSSPFLQGMSTTERQRLIEARNAYVQQRIPERDFPQSKFGPSSAFKKLINLYIAKTEYSEAVKSGIKDGRISQEELNKIDQAYLDFLQAKDDWFRTVIRNTLFAAQHNNIRLDTDTKKQLVKRYLDAMRIADSTKERPEGWPNDLKENFPKFADVLDEIIEEEN